LIEISDYHHDRKILFQGTHQTPEPRELYLGTEVECESRDGDDYWNTDSLGSGLLECGFIPLFDPTHDGSLNYGVEFVSYPLTLDKWMSVKEGVVKPGFSQLIDAEMRGHQNNDCGLHVHVSRSFFHHGNLDKRFWEIVGNMFIIMEQNWYAFANFARREANDYAKRIMSSAQRSQLKSRLKGLDYATETRGDRYRAINLQRAATIEFRLFRGTLNVNTYYATLQFVDNFCRVAKAASREDALEMDIMDIINFRRYPELTEYSETRKLTTNNNPIVSMATEE